MKNGNVPCPLCRANIRANDLHRVITEERDSTDEEEVSLDVFGKIKRIVCDTEKFINENRKVIIFTQYKESMNLVKQECKQKLIEFASISGSLSEKKRRKEIQKFNTNVNVFLLSVRTGAAGIDLSSASDIIFLEPLLHNIRQQAISRAHRLGQSKIVTIHDYIYTDTIESTVFDMGERFVATNASLVYDLLH